MMPDRLIYSIDILKCDVLINHCQTLIYYNIIRFIFIGSDEDAIFFSLSTRCSRNQRTKIVGSQTRSEGIFKIAGQYLSKTRFWPFWNRAPTRTRVDRLKRFWTVPDFICDVEWINSDDNFISLNSFNLGLWPDNLFYQMFSKMVLSDEI